MTIIFFLLNWLCWNSWFISHLFLFQSDFFFDSGFSCNESVLKISSLSFCLSDCHNVFSVGINSWIFSLVLFFFILFSFGIFYLFGSSLRCIHFSPRFFYCKSLLSGSSKSSSLIGFWSINDWL